MILLETLLYAVGLNLLMFIPAYLFKTDKLTDISYAATFFLITGYLFTQSSQSFVHIFLFAMISLWAVRLGGYLLYRIHKMGRDKRFDERRNKFWSFLNFWVFQGVLAWILLIPAIYIMQQSDLVADGILYTGLAIWLIGLLIEGISDYQKFSFIQKPSNKGKWIESGLWKYSRHPNYFGEILVWVGVYIFALTNLSGFSVLIAAASPVFISLSLIFVTGLPLLEKAADKRWGSDSDYQDYKKRTSILVPMPPKK